MEEYYFLFALAFIWIVFAVVQDVRRREVANWLNFSLIAIGLAYRAFYSIYKMDYWFFVYGLIGFGVFYLLAMLFYYGKVFAGGDAKLLMGIGAVLPIGSLKGIGLESMGFIFVLFIGGAVYSLVYSIGLAIRNRKKFAGEFKVKMGKSKLLMIGAVLLMVLLLVASSLNVYNVVLAVLIFLLPFLYAYVLALDKCMEKLVGVRDLSEGDWLVNDIRVGNKVIRKTVHGLSLKDIEILRKAGKKVLIKEGIPFTPAFLIAIIFMVFFYLFLSQNFEKILSFLF